MKISEFYGKKIESTAGKRGYVISVNARGSSLECLICADENENEFTVDIKNIMSVDEKIIYEDRESAIKSATPVRLGCVGYDENGKFLGNLQDFTFKGNKLLNAKIGKKNYPAEGLICGDAILVKPAKKLKSSVIKDGKVILKKGERITDEVLDYALEQGEYVQTTMKSI